MAVLVFASACIAQEGGKRVCVQAEYERCRMLRHPVASSVDVRASEAKAVALADQILESREMSLDGEVGLNFVAMTAVLCICSGFTLMLLSFDLIRPSLSFRRVHLTFVRA